MALLIATEASLFAYLLFSYFYLAARSGGAWPPVGPPALRVALPNTAILLSSSAVLWWAERERDRGRRSGMAVGAGCDDSPGRRLPRAAGCRVQPADHYPCERAYGSAFFTITGLHGAHVFVGLIDWAQSRARDAIEGRLDPTRRHYLSNAAMYWRFVDAVWIAVFTSLYVARGWACDHLRERALVGGIRCGGGVEWRPLDCRRHRSHPVPAITGRHVAVRPGMVAASRNYDRGDRGERVVLPGVCPVPSVRLMARTPGESASWHELEYS